MESSEMDRMINQKVGSIVGDVVFLSKAIMALKRTNGVRVTIDVNIVNGIVLPNVKIDVSGTGLDIDAELKALLEANGRRYTIKEKKA